MDSFRVATFNVENFNRVGSFFAGRPNDPAYDEGHFERKCAWIAGILDEGRVDLVGFQEVFSYEALTAAVSRSHYLGGSGVTVRSPETEDRRNERTDKAGRVEAVGPHVGFATRLPVESCESVVDFPSRVTFEVPLGLAGEDEPVITLPITRFERPVIRARIRLPGDKPATVLVAHLKSKRPKFLKTEDRADPLVQALGNTRSLIVRAAEAVALRALALSIIDDARDGDAGEPLIVLGDLNDDLPSVTTQTVAGEEPRSFAPKPHKQKIWDVQLYSVHDIQESQSYRDVSYTHVFGGRYELLDHIFVSQELVRQFPDRIAEVRSTRIFNDHILDERLAIRLPGSRLAPSLRSDHGIPVTEFSMCSAGASLEISESTELE